MRIELRAVRKRFGAAEVLKGIDLSVPAGRRVALIGPNGSGKSTLLRSLLGLVECEGEVRLDGRSPFDDRREVARRLAYVPQVAPQLGASVEDVVSLVARTRELAPAAIVRLAERLDLDVEALRGRPFRALSGGMKQKLLIALALAADASLLVMDEPTASLDARARERFFALCDELAPGRTLVLCSHRLEELRHLAGHVVSLEEGRVTYDGPAGDFLGGRGLAVVEVATTSLEAAGWLQARGFRTGLRGWWVRTLSQAEKRELVPELARELGPRMSDLLVRDLETVEVPHGGN
ncbi:ATP-binding cassette domain-containing protein [Myxococcus sp. RHSTA-1-4]|uniref:ATP-binding cassette domain-containing protein n=1 Tax=Myxococcus sp. RHSTA-1-4 TaxID=2874601 RepID=UPI001CC1B8C7|nr:ABC transporter ATP-binding protein [Myxococcus sp. RHSTA-1-4]MBZ4415000.1 ABC transporter ATP-binding protein [Myxococcus sp. RHSTA-1-4]